MSRLMLPECCCHCDVLANGWSVDIGEGVVLLSLVGTRGGRIEVREYCWLSGPIAIYYSFVIYCQDQGSGNDTQASSHAGAVVLAVLTLMAMEPRAPRTSILWGDSSALWSICAFFSVVGAYGGLVTQRRQLTVMTSDSGWHAMAVDAFVLIAIVKGFSAFITHSQLRFVYSSTFWVETSSVQFIWWFVFSF